MTGTRHALFCASRSYRVLSLNAVALSLQLTCIIRGGSLTGTPDSFADRPEMGGPAAADSEAAHDPDLLSGLLQSVRLRGEQIFCCAPAEPFAISLNHAGGTVHVLNEGQFELQFVGHRHAYRYEKGDVVLLPVGAAHVVRSGRRVPPRPLVETDTREEVIRHGAGTRWLSGTFSFDDSRGGRLLHALPPVIDLHGARDQSPGWLEMSTQMLMKEKVSPSEGSAEMISRSSTCSSSRCCELGP